MMEPSLPILSFLDINQLIFHEKHDHQRTIPLIERIRESGFFRNPPIVAPLNDGSGRYMLLDGANRMTALQEMGFPHILVQVVEPDSPGLALENWNHVIWEMDSDELLAALDAIEGLSLGATKDANFEPDLWGECGLALAQLPDGSLHTICAAEDDLEKRVYLLNDIVDCYRYKGKLDRTTVRDIGSIKSLYANLTGLIIFPQFEVEQVQNLASSSCLLPAGITRFTVSPRALHVNYPLYELASDKPLEEKNAALRAWIQHRLAIKGIRYYAEATFLFDE